jgi:hypothetical protein
MLRFRFPGLCAGLVVCAFAGTTHAALTGPFAGLTSDGSLGSFTALEARMGYDPSYSYGLDTDTGQVYVVYGNQWSQTDVAGARNGSSIVVNQTNGPSVRVFDFSTFQVDANQYLYVRGSMAAAIVSQGDMTINGSIVTTANGRAGGYGGGNIPNTNAAAGGGAGLPNSGGGGPGAAQLGWFNSVANPCCYNYISGAGGGGGGFISAGGNGQGGFGASVFVNGTPTYLRAAGGDGGQGSNQTPHVLVGGSGGGGGGIGLNQGLEPGAQGAAGGGALLFLSGGDLTIGLTDRSAPMAPPGSGTTRLRPVPGAADRVARSGSTRRLRSSTTAVSVRSAVRAARPTTTRKPTSRTAPTATASAVPARAAMSRSIRCRSSTTASSTSRTATAVVAAAVW